MDLSQFRRLDSGSHEGTCGAPVPSVPAHSTRYSVMRFVLRESRMPLTVNSPFAGVCGVAGALSFSFPSQTVSVSLSQFGSLCACACRVEIADARRVIAGPGLLASPMRVPAYWCRGRYVGASCGGEYGGGGGVGSGGGGGGGGSGGCGGSCVGGRLLWVMRGV
jgi:hypothetical protein